MPPNKHAVLSASSSHRWLNCSPSARLELEFDDNETAAAAEGTAAHALCEHKLRRALKLRSDKPVSQYDCDEMDEYTDGYVQFVLEAIAEIKETCKDPMVLIEQRLDFSKYVPDGFGTGDCVIVGDGTLHIIDFKYGQGVLVRAEHNPQMMLYALGALGIFDGLYDIEEVSMSIYQPRRENVDTWRITVAELKEWADNILIPKAKQAIYELLKLDNQQQTQLLINTIPDRSVLTFSHSRQTEFSPYQTDQIAAGNYQVALSLPGYDNLNFPFTITPGYQLKITAKLAQTFTE